MRFLSFLILFLLESCLFNAHRRPSDGVSSNPAVCASGLLATEDGCIEKDACLGKVLEEGHECKDTPQCCAEGLSCTDGVCQKPVYTGSIVALEPSIELDNNTTKLTARFKIFGEHLEDAVLVISDDDTEPSCDTGKKLNKDDDDTYFISYNSGIKEPYYTKTVKAIICLDGKQIGEPIEKTVAILHPVTEITVNPADENDECSVTVTAIKGDVDIVGFASDPVESNTVPKAPIDDAYVVTNTTITRDFTIKLGEKLVVKVENENGSSARKFSDKCIKEEVKKGVYGDLIPKDSDASDFCESSVARGDDSNFCGCASDEDCGGMKCLLGSNLGGIGADSKGSNICELKEGTCECKDDTVINNSCLDGETPKCSSGNLTKPCSCREIK